MSLLSFIVIGVTVAIVQVVLVSFGFLKQKNDKTGMDKFCCQVCGYPKKTPSEQCDCCGNKLNISEHLPIKELSKLRNIFKQNNYQWHNKKQKPEEWDFAKQISIYGITPQWYGREKEHYEFLRQIFDKAAKNAGIKKYFILDMYDDDPMDSSGFTPQSGTLMTQDGKIYEFTMENTGLPKRPYAVEAYKELNEVDFSTSIYNKALSEVKKPKKEYLVWYDNIIDYFNQCDSISNPESDNSTYRIDQFPLAPIKTKVDKPNVQKMIEDSYENIVPDLFIYIGQITSWGEDMSNLTEPQKNFYLVQVFEGEINNGGFGQFFANSGVISKTGVYLPNI